MNTSKEFFKNLATFLTILVVSTLSLDAVRNKTGEQKSQEIKRKATKPDKVQSDTGTKPEILSDTDADIPEATKTNVRPIVHGAAGQLTNLLALIYNDLQRGVTQEQIRSLVQEGATNFQSGKAQAQIRSLAQEVAGTTHEIATKIAENAPTQKSLAETDRTIKRFVNGLFLMCLLGTMYMTHVTKTQMELQSHIMP